MGSWIGTSLLFALLVADLWFVGAAFRAGQIDAGRYFGRQLRYRWPDQPVRFLFVVSFHAILCLLLFAFAIEAVKRVDPVLWALWPGLLAPLVSYWLLRRQRGAWVAPERVRALGSALFQAERGAYAAMVRTLDEGATKRVLASAIPAAETTQAAGFRASAGPSRRDVAPLLRSALRVERSGRALRLLPSLLVLTPFVAFEARPPLVIEPALPLVTGLALVLSASVLVVAFRDEQRLRAVVAALV